MKTLKEMREELADIKKIRDKLRANSSQCKICGVYRDLDNLRYYEDSFMVIEESIAQRTADLKDELEFLEKSLWEKPDQSQVNRRIVKINEELK